MKVIKPLLIVLVLLAIGSCVTAPRKKAPQKAPVDVRNELSQIHIDIAANANKKALARLQKLVQQYPDSDVADDAYILMGNIYYKSREYDLAYQAFMSVVNSNVFSPNEGEALIWAAKSLTKQGRFDEALSLTKQSIRIPGLSDNLKLENYRLRYSILSELGDRLDALRALIYLAENDPNEANRDGYRLRALDFIESRLNDEELETVGSEQEFGFVRAYAIYRVASLLFEQRDFSNARDHFSDVIELLPQSEIAELSQRAIEQIDARRQVNPKTIGAVLPLTGKHSNVAYRTLKGLQLGLGIYGPEQSGFRLAVIDSEGNPDVARRAVERLVTEDHVVAIVGSLLSKTSVAVASKADELGVPSIGLSQKSGLTEIGPTVFRNALTSEMQVRQLARMAIEKMGLKRFAILYPNDLYGVEFANLFWDEVVIRGGQVTGAQSYSPKETDFSGPIKRLVGTYYLEDRLEEYKLRLKDWHAKQKTVSLRAEPPEDLLPPIVDFDAIFIPDSVRALGQIAPTLAYHDITKVKLLGTNLWNTPTLIERGQKHVEDCLFVDSLPESDQEFKRSQFYREYKRVFNEEPGLFEAQAYDAALMLRQVIASGERSRVGVAEKLSQLKQFPGSIGALAMSSRREVHRPLVSLTVFQGKIEPYSSTKQTED